MFHACLRESFRRKEMSGMLQDRLFPDAVKDRIDNFHRLLAYQLFGY
jgi:hypothetical protein